MISSHVQVRRLFAAPDNKSEVLASTSNGLLLPFVYKSKNSVESNCELHYEREHSNNLQSVCEEWEKKKNKEYCNFESLHLCEASEQNPYIHLPYPVIDLAWCPFKNRRENSAVMIACRSQPLQLWDVCFDNNNDTTNKNNYLQEHYSSDDEDDDDSICDRNELRASYLAFNDSNAHVYPHAVCWYTSTSNNKASSFVAAGYGGFEDKTSIRIFDVCVEGNNAVWSYTSPRIKLLPAERTRARRMVSCLANGPAPTQGNLLMCGYYNYDAVELVDTRHHTQALLLHGLASCGTGCLRTLSELPYCVFAIGRGNRSTVKTSKDKSSDIVCWDIRKATCELACLMRNSSTTQLCEMSFVQNESRVQEHLSNHSQERLSGDVSVNNDKNNSEVINLVATSSCTTSNGESCSSNQNSGDGGGGGVVVYRDIVKTIKTGNVSNNSDGYRKNVILGEQMYTELGSTSGLCVVSPSRFAVVTGSRSYTFSHLHDRIGKLPQDEEVSERNEDEMYQLSKKRRRKNTQPLTCRVQSEHDPSCNTITVKECRASSSSSDLSSDFDDNNNGNSTK